MTATIDGQTWSAGTTAGSVTALQVSSRSGSYLILGTEFTGGGQGSSVSFAINNIIGTGTYPLGVDAVSVHGGFASITSGAGGVWMTPLSGAAGTINITALTTTRIAGTFSFTATGSGGGATGTRTVTNGVFDAPFGTAVTLPSALPDSVGSKITATVAGTAWNAAIVAAGTNLGYLSISGINTQQTLVLTLPQPTTTGTYQLANTPGRILQAWDPNAVAPAGARCCWGILGDTGTMTITSITVTRAKGTFSAVLSPQPGTAARGQLVISNGTFDVGLFHRP
jgi:hypothetical protein